MQSTELQCITRTILKILNLKYIYMFYLKQSLASRTQSLSILSTKQFHTCIKKGVLSVYGYFETIGKVPR